MILNTLPLINHLQAQIAPLRGEITLIQCLWMRLYMRKMSTICRIKMNSTMETVISYIHQMRVGIITWWIIRELESFLGVSVSGLALLWPRQMYAIRTVTKGKDSLWYLWIKQRLISSKPCSGRTSCTRPAASVIHPIYLQVKEKKEKIKRLEAM